MENEGFHMRIVKRIIKKKKNYNSQSRKRGKGEGSIIIEIDEETHKIILSKEKLNVGWKKPCV